MDVFDRPLPDLVASSVGRLLLGLLQLSSAELVQTAKQPQSFDTHIMTDHSPFLKVQ